MKFLVFSDLHSHQHREYGTILESGIHSRLNDCLNVIIEIADYAHANSVPLVLFGGDVFHTRKWVDTTVLNHTYRAFEYLASKARVVMIAGNHDQYSKDNSVVSIELFRKIPNLTIASDEVVEIKEGNDTLQISCIPFHENIQDTWIKIQELANPRGVLLSHAELLAASTTKGYQFDMGLEPLSIAKLYDLAFIGHIHKFQKLAHNVYIPGSPLAHNWGDANDDKGFLLVDSNTKIVQRIVSGAPKFRQVSDVSELNNKDFFRLTSDRKISSTEIQEIKGTTKNLVIFEEADIQKKNRSEIDVTMGYGDMIEKYILARNPGLDVEKLKKLGIECISES